MIQPPAPTIAAAPKRLNRRLVLAAAFLIGLAAALAPPARPVNAQEPKPAPVAPGKESATTKTVTISDGRGAEAKMTLELKDAPAPAANVTAAESTPEEATPSDPRRKATSGAHNVQIDKHGRVKINGLGTDREFDSLGDFVHDQPAIAGMIVAVVSVVFLSPVLAIGLILWYRMRKQRMLNETLLKLAERGIVPPAEAMNALASGRQTAVLSSAASAAPLFEEAKQVRRRAAWSDLRKGVILGGIGLGLTLFSALDDRSPNSLGLVLLFVGIGYIVLWWFEQRQLVTAAGATPGASTPGSNPGNTPPLA